MNTVREDGAIELIGRDGRRIVANSDNLTICHLPDMDGEIDMSLAYVSDDLECSACGSAAHGGDMPLCDNCGRGWHIWCLDPPLEEVPTADVWLCHECREAGVAEADIDMASALFRELICCLRSISASARRRNTECSSASITPLLSKSGGMPRMPPWRVGL